MNTLPRRHAVLTLARVVQFADSLPTVPRVLAQIQELLKDTNSGIEEISALLRRDSGLATRVMRIANSIVYNKGDPVASLEEALGRVGFGEVYRIAGLASIMQMANFQMRFYPVGARRLRENAVFVALAMEEMAFLAGMDARTAYTAGLLRSTGKLVLDAAAQSDLRYLLVPPMPPEGLLPWETELFGLPNTRVAESLLRTWHFPAEVVVPIRDHYLHALAIEALPEAKLLHFAAAIAESSDLGLPGEVVYWEKHAQQVGEDFAIDDAQLQGIVARTTARFEQIRPTLA